MNPAALPDKCRCFGGDAVRLSSRGRNLGKTAPACFHELQPRRLSRRRADAGGCHAFAADDRGAHLVALLERISRLSQYDVQRIGLSATVGDPEAICEWLAGSSARPGRVINPGGPGKQADQVRDMNPGYPLLPIAKSPANPFAECG